MFLISNYISSLLNNLVIDHMVNYDRIIICKYIPKIELKVIVNKVLKIIVILIIND